jgi:hypothetical protein
MPTFNKNLHDPVNPVWWQSEQEGGAEIFWSDVLKHYKLFELPQYGGELRIVCASTDLNELITKAENLT